MDDREDLKIKKLFEQVQIRKPAERDLENFEAEVWGRIRGAAGVPVFSWLLPAAAVAAAASLAVLWFWVLRPVEVQQTRGSAEETSSPPAQTVLVSQEIPAVQQKQALQSVRQEKPVQVNAPAEGIPEADFEALAEDILLLQMLGEDSGISEEIDAIETDIDLLDQLAAPSPLPA